MRHSASPMSGRAVFGVGYRTDNNCSSLNIWPGSVAVEDRIITAARFHTFGTPGSCGAVAIRLTRDVAPNPLRTMRLSAYFEIIRQQSGTFGLLNPSSGALRLRLSLRQYQGSKVD
jgi:hypothetical protein